MSQRVIVLEGRVSVEAAIVARQRAIHSVLLRRDAPGPKLRQLRDLADAAGLQVRMVERQELEGLTHGTSHGGVVALVGPKPRLSPDALLERLTRLERPALLLMLEGIDDARNLGFVLRSAEACGCDAVLVKKHLWDFDETEISRPSSGAYERLPLVQLEDVGPLQQLRRSGVRVVGCLAGAKRAVWKVDLQRPTLLVIGGEKRGLSGATRAVCDRFVTIPTVGGATSLSLSHAAAMCLGEVLRQRHSRESQ